MTIEEAKKFLPIIQAYTEGKTIQVNYPSTGWKDSYLLSFNGSPSSYRIKPETKYRPFANAEECWKEMEKHQPFGWVQDKVSKAFYNIAFLNIKILYIGTSNISHDYTDILFNFTFPDGTPFGIKVEG